MTSLPFFIGLIVEPFAIQETSMTTGNSPSLAKKQFHE